MATDWVADIFGMTRARDRQELARLIGEADTHLGDCPRDEWLLLADVIIDAGWYRVPTP